MRARELLVAALLFLAVSVVQSWPLASRLGRSVPYDPVVETPATARVWTWVWNTGHVREALERGETPWRARLDWPVGARLHNHPLTLGWAVAALPFEVLGGPLLAVGALFLLLPVTAALAVHLLAREVGASSFAAALAGWLWAFSPFYARAALGELPLVACPWPPALALCLLRATRRGQPRRARSLAALGAGLTLGLAWLSSWTAAAWTLLALALVLAFLPSAPHARRRAVLAPGTWIAFVSFALIAGSLRPWPDWTGGVAWLHPARSELGRPALASFLRLGSRHPLGQEVGLEPDVALGVVLPALCAVALGLAPAARRWLAAGLAGLLLVWDPLGLAVRAAGTWAPLAWIGHAGSLLPAATLPLAVAAALGLDALCRRPRGALASAWLVLLLAFETWPRPAAMTRLDPPEPVRAIASDPGQGSVLVLPVRFSPSVSDAWQLVHAHPNAAGWVGRTAPRAPLLWQRSAQDLFALAFPRLLGRDPAEPDTDGLEMDLDTLGIDHVLVQEDDPIERARLCEALDAIRRFERGPSGGGVDWWHRSRVDDPARAGHAP